jgi:hypothetical protein
MVAVQEHYTEVMDRGRLRCFDVADKRPSVIRLEYPPESRGEIVRVRADHVLEEGEERAEEREIADLECANESAEKIRVEEAAEDLARALREIGRAHV